MVYFVLFCVTSLGPTHFPSCSSHTVNTFFLRSCTRNLAHNAVNTRSQSLLHRKSTCTRPVRLPFLVTTLKIEETLSLEIGLLLECVDTGEFPDDVKLAEVVPLYKKDDNLNMKNYRPVSILPSMSKVLEKIILHQMSCFLREILDPIIAAYRHGYSCQDVLLKLIDDWKRALERRRHVGALLMDLSKAFDCLPHQLLVGRGQTKSIRSLRKILCTHQVVSIR